MFTCEVLCIQVKTSILLSVRQKSGGQFPYSKHSECLTQGFHDCNSTTVFIPFFLPQKVIRVANTDFYCAVLVYGDTFATLTES